MTQPYYRFITEVDGVSASGTKGNIHQHYAGEVPIASLFNGNTNLLFTVFSNIDERLTVIDTVNPLNANADDVIFDLETTNLTDMINVIEDMKGVSWDNPMDNNGKSMEDIYNKDTFNSGLQTYKINCDTFISRESNLTLSGTATIDMHIDNVTMSGTNLTVNSQVELTSHLRITSGSFKIESGNSTSSEINFLSALPNTTDVVNYEFHSADTIKKVSENTWNASKYWVGEDYPTSMLVSMESGWYGAISYNALKDTKVYIRKRTDLDSPHYGIIMSLGDNEGSFMASYHTSICINKE